MPTDTSAIRARHSGSIPTGTCSCCCSPTACTRRKRDVAPFASHREAHGAQVHHQEGQREAQQLEYYQALECGEEETIGDAAPGARRRVIADSPAPGGVGFSASSLASARWSDDVASGPTGSIHERTRYDARGRSAGLVCNYAHYAHGD